MPLKRLSSQDEKKVFRLVPLDNASSNIMLDYGFSPIFEVMVIA